MNVKLYAGDSLVYDNLLPEEEGYNIFSLAIEETVNKGGVATILMSRDHPASDKFSSYNVPVTVYRDGKLRWRGRPIPPAKEDVFGRKTITCEGELCFLQDAIHRPHSYSGPAADVFSQIISVYNAAVEPWKRFAVGNVTVIGNVNVIIKEPKNVLEAVQAVIEQCGGYILFDSTADGSRRINWYKHFPYSCNQTVRYGENLIDFNCQPVSSDFATRIIPYGAIGDDGNRIKINVNGKDYVENAEAVAVHGIIEKAVVYSDISDPTALWAKAESDVAVLGLLPSIIRLKAIDMSRQDLTLDAFAVGQQVLAESVAHGLSGSYYLTSLSEDFVNPQVGGVTLQREQASICGGVARTLTGAIAVSGKGLLSAAKNSADLSAASAVANQSQEYIFNKLTQNGKLQGLYMKDGQLYINASYLMSGIIDAAVVQVVNLIAEKLRSVAGNAELNVDGAELRYLMNGNETLVMASSAMPILYMTDYEGSGPTNHCELTPHHLKVGGTSTQPVFELSTRGGAPKLNLVSTGYKALSWKDNGDGTFTLIGQ